MKKKIELYLPNKYLMMLVDKLYSIHSVIEQYTYKKMYDRLDYLYDNGMFKEARNLINSVEKNTTTVKFDIDLRLKEMDWNEKSK